MPMTIAAQNARTTSNHATPARLVPQQTAVQPQQAQTKEQTQHHGVRAAEKQPGERKDPTWKLAKLLDGKK
jgi:hypothetical protein